MHGELLATHALAFACAGNFDAAEAAATESSISNQVEARILRHFARAVACAESAEGEEVLSDALAVAEATQNYDGFVSAYRAYPRLLRLLARVPNRWTILEDVVDRVDPQLRRRFRLHAIPQPSRSLLSQREIEVLELLRRGLSNKEIAKTLWIAESTAKVHVRNILSKLGVRTRTQAAVWQPTDVRPILPPALSDHDVETEN
jgi:DNA-binding CsgD family transcriptional regulator